MITVDHKGGRGVMGMSYDHSITEGAKCIISRKRYTNDTISEGV